MHQLTEIDKIVMLAMVYGALGWLFQSIIQNIINHIKNYPQRNIAQKINFYIFSCFAGSILMGLFIFFGAMFDTSASIQNSGQFIIIYIIIGFPLITLNTELISILIFKSEDN